MEQQRTIWTVVITVVVAVLVVVTVMAYQSKRESAGEVIEPVPDVEAQDYASKEAISVDFKLPTINQGAYALWQVKEEGQFLLVKLFRYDNKGFLTDLAGKPLNNIFPVAGNDFTQASSFLVTIEKGDEQPVTPSETIVLTGNKPKGNNWSLSFPVDLSTVSGSYMLATPTNGPQTNETAGVWFVKVAGNSREQASLSLPVAPAGWVYEGWVTAGNNTLTAGRFTSPASKDNFSNYSGPRSFPPYPGEDYLTNAPVDKDVTFPLNLADGQSRVLISLEPGSLNEDPTGNSRFDLNLLEAAIAEGAEDHTDYSLNLVKERPSGTVKVLIK